MAKPGFRFSLSIHLKSVPLEISSRFCQFYGFSYPILPTWLIWVCLKMDNYTHFKRPSKFWGNAWKWSLTMGFQRFSPNFQTSPYSDVQLPAFQLSLICIYSIFLPKSALSQRPARWTRPSERTSVATVLCECVPEIPCERTAWLTLRTRQSETPPSIGKSIKNLVGHSRSMEPFSDC